MTVSAAPHFLPVIPRDSLEVLSDDPIRKVFDFVENPIPLLSASKRLSKHASGALRGKNRLINTLLNKCGKDLKQFQKGFLKTEGWSHTITALDLQSKLNRDNLRYITQLFSQLQSLMLSVDFSENVFSELVRLKSLQELILVGPDNSHCDLDRITIQNGHFEEIAKIETLQKLSIENGIIAADSVPGFEHLVACCSLQELNLEDFIDGDRAIQAIGKIKTLKRLGLKFLLSNIDKLPALTELEHFSFYKSLLSTNDLVVIGNMASLKTLNLRGLFNEDNPDGFQHLTRLTQLREISLPQIFRNKNKIFEYLRQIKTIEKIHGTGESVLWSYVHGNDEQQYDVCTKPFSM
jgi:hypothetical protein